MTKLPPLPKKFLESQSCRLLLDRDQPRRHLTRQGVRGEPGRMPNPLGPGSGAGSGAEFDAADVWWEIDRPSLIAGRATAPVFPFVDPQGQPLQRRPGFGVKLAESSHSLHRVMLTGDGGTGKSFNLRWLAWMLSGGEHGESHSGPATHPTSVFLFNLYDLPDVRNDFLGEVMLPKIREMAAAWQSAAPGLASSDAREHPARFLGVDHFPDEVARRWLERERRRGELTLLFDGLDQVAGSGHAIRVLAELLGNIDWNKCRIMIAGRPSAAQRHWERLLEPHPEFQFVAFDEFTDDQQKALLGPRYDKLPPESRKLLSNPRAVDYILQVPEDEVGDLHTAANVYERATWHMLKTGLSGSERARRLGLAPGEPTPTKVQRRQMLHAQKLLGAIAFEMTCMPAAPDASETGNFEQVRAGVEFEAFCGRVCRRLGMHTTETDRRLFEHDLDALVALNDPFQQTFLDADAQDLDGLDQILWRDRTLQEFFTALYAVRWGDDEDARRFEPWIYLPHDPRTEGFYMVWQFAVEMPERSLSQESWVKVVRHLYRPRSGDEPVRRSNEMIYRAWDRMEVFAPDVLRGFQGEFAEILAGRRGTGKAARRDQQTAREFVQSFVELPTGWFRMGTPREKQGMPEDARRYWTNWLNNNRPNPEAAVDKLMEKWYYPNNKQGRELRANSRLAWIRIANASDTAAELRSIERRQYRPDETPAVAHRRVDEFALNKYPTLNAWYRLFDPGHGLRGDNQSLYERISGQSNTPAIFVSWYDAWVFCRWASWDGECCQLPHEDEWEYACKACDKCTEQQPCANGDPCDWNYWWEDQFLQARCTANQTYATGSTTAPVSHDRDGPTGHRNGYGLVDMSGNVWEWTDDTYRERYERAENKKASRIAARVLRGGSWLDESRHVRSSIRDDLPPSFSSDHTGFRVCRVVCVARGSS